MGGQAEREILSVSQNGQYSPSDSSGMIQKGNFMVDEECFLFICLKNADLAFEIVLVRRLLFQFLVLCMSLSLAMRGL